MIPVSPKRRNRPASGLEHLIFRRMGQVIGDFGLVQRGDRILVAVSGGKDSFALLHLLDLHRRRAPFTFTLVPVFLDSGWDPGIGDRVQAAFAAQGYPVEVLARDIRGNVEKCLRPGTNPCALCSRLRRGVLYDLAPEKGCNKIALGHHLDDFAETLMLNLMYTGQLKSMGVNLRSDDGRNRVIRPLAYIEERLLEDFCGRVGFLPVSIGCPYRSWGKDPQRARIKALLAQLAEHVPGLRRSILAAMKHVRATHLMDPNLGS